MIDTTPPFDERKQERAMTTPGRRARRKLGVRGTPVRLDVPTSDLAYLKVAADKVGAPLAQFIIEAARMRAESVLER